MATIPEAESCQLIASELRQLLMRVDSKWRALETRVEENEERTLHEHKDDLEKWFGSDIKKSLADWNSGGLRRKTRDRVQKLLLGPLTEHMRVIASLPTEDKDNLSASPEVRETPSHPIDDLLEHWNNDVQQALDHANKQDGRHGRKIARLEKVRAGADLKLEQQKRSSLWSDLRATLTQVEGPVRELAKLLDTSLSDEAVARCVAMVPAIVARSVCDWHYQSCMAEFSQLSGWWQGVRAAFQKRPKLWERLLEKDGHFVSRIERGIEEIESEKLQYITFANFGHSGTSSASLNGAWPVEAGSLLAHTVKEMRRRLRPIRDAAAWYIIDSAKAIHKQLLEEEKCQEKSAWEQVTCQEGMTMLCRALNITTLPTRGDWNIYWLFDEVDPVDVALRFSNVLDGLAGVIADLEKLVDDERVPDTGGLSYILGEILQEISYVHEDLLAVLDDATQESLSDWLRTWGKWGDSQIGPRLGAAMTAMLMKLDSSLPHDHRQARRSKLATMRGLQALLDDSAYRTLLLYLAVFPPRDASDNSGIVSAHMSTARSQEYFLEIADVESLSSLSLCKSEAPVSPRSGYVSRKPCTQVLEEPNLTHERNCEDKENAIKPNVNRPKCLEPSPNVDKAKCEAEMDVPGSEDVSKMGDPAKIIEIGISTSATIPEPTVSPKQVVPSRPQSRPGTNSRPRCTSTPSRRKSQIIVESTPSKTSKSIEPSALPPNPGRGTSIGTTAFPTPGRAGTSSRPVTPSWLDPPWPRSAQEIPFKSWTRPGTPSTVCDEADLVIATPKSKSKLVDGLCVALRPTSSCTNLPPLTSPLCVALRPTSSCTRLPPLTSPLTGKKAW